MAFRGPEGGASRRRGYAAAVAACALLTLAVLPLHGALDNANIVMLYQLTVVGIALRFGRGPAVLAAFVNVAAFDFCMVPPRFSFAVGDVQYLLTFSVMLAVGLIVGQLTAGLRSQAQVATHREQRSRSLFEVARRLSAELEVGQVVATASTAIEREFDATVRLYLRDPDDCLVRFEDQGQGDEAGLDAETAQWAFDHERAAGLETATASDSAWLYLPLKASMRTRGVLALRPRSAQLPGLPDQRRHLETFATLVAIVLERLHYVEVAGRATVQIESERLRNSILSALSHDLRTPLAGLAALAESLQLSAPPLTGAQAELAKELQSSALRMNSQVVNLLDMARMQSGQVQMVRVWNSIEEIVGSAIRLSRRALADRIVTTSVPSDLPLVECDAVLIERVLLNLLENASKYTPAGTTVAVNVRAGAAEMTVAVEDDGPGIAAGQEDAIFEKFTRGARESATAGVGLGLAICRAVVRAHGGAIGARRRDPYGASFTFTLPLTEPPTLAHDDGDDDADRPER